MSEISISTSTYAQSVYNAYKKSSDTDVKDTDSSTESEEGAVYEGSASSSSSATYSINKMSAEDRAALVQQLKDDQESRQQSLISIAQQMMTGQASAYSIANDSDDIWSFLASGDYTIDEAAKVKAQEDISEDGYWGVTQTSQRLFDFASALAGDDVDQMKKMQEAMQEGYEQATAAWGKDLPEISSQTLEAVNKLFEDYYSSKSSEE